MRVIGVCGHPSSGKDTAAEYIASRGFAHVSAGDIIRRDMKAVGLEVDRTSTNTYVNERRAKDGASYPMLDIAEMIVGNTVVSGFRNVTEVNVLRKKFGGSFTFVAIEAPIDVRYERARGRGRVGDDITFERFKQEEEVERAASEFYEVDRVVAQADYLVLNDGSVEDLHTKIDGILSKLDT